MTRARGGAGAGAGVHGGGRAVQGRLPRGLPRARAGPAPPACGVRAAPPQAPAPRLTPRTRSRIESRILLDCLPEQARRAEAGPRGPGRQRPHFDTRRGRRMPRHPGRRAERIGDAE